MTLLLVIFAAVLLFSFAVIFIMTRPRGSEKKVQGRLDLIRAANIEVENEQVALARPEGRGFAARISEHLQSYGFSKDLEQLICHAGSKASVGGVALTSLALAAFGGAAFHLFIGPLPLVLLATALGGASRYAILRFQKSRRLKKFNTALPDAIELMARALRAGHSMSSSIEIIAEQSPEPLAGEFAICFQQQKFGIAFRDALLEIGERVPSKDLHFLITAVLVQKETGGDLTEILDRTTHVIRERVRIEGEVRTYTAQGRLTGWILGLLPVIMLGIINIMTPGYSHILFYDPLGQKLLYAGGTLILIGGLIIRKIVTIKV
jgi:tight adherence protein B